MLAHIAQSAITLINIPEKLPASVSDRDFQRVNKSAGLVRRIDADLQVPIVNFATSQRQAQLGRQCLGQEIIGDPLMIFSGDALRPVLGGSACRHLYLGGFWLDEDVLVAALAAQTKGLDTRVLIDLSIARDDFFRSSTIMRLNQQGILLTTIRQSLFEWALTANDLNLREKLKFLLDGNTL